MTRITIDESDFPVVVVTFPSERLTDEDIEGYIDAIEAIQRRGQRFFQIVDSRDVVSALTAQQLKRFVTWAESPSARMAARLRLGDGIVVVNPLVKGAMTAVLFFARPVAPTRACTTLGEAARFAEQRFREEGITVPERVARRLRSL